ncbi:MAG: cytochrome c [Parvularculaceae bacterium]
MDKLIAVITAAALVAAFAASCASGPEKAAGDAARGRSIAQNVCAECHAVTPDETSSPNDKAPTFVSLANRPGMSRMALAVLLRTPHRNMPNLIVPADDVENLAAYLETLRDI